jgi:hypothetical protein
MESAISVDSLTNAFSPSAVRTLTGAQMSQYNSPQCGPYSSIFNVSSVIAEHINASRVAAAATTFGLNPASAAVMLQSRIPDHHHHQHHHHSQYSILSLPESASALNICGNNNINNNVIGAMSEMGSPAPSTDGDSIGEQFHTQDSPTSALEDNKLFTLKRAIQASTHFGSKALECNPSFSPKEQENNLINGNKSSCNSTPKKHRVGKTVSIKEVNLVFSPFLNLINQLLSSIQRLNLMSIKHY